MVQPTQTTFFDQVILKLQENMNKTPVEIAQEALVAKVISIAAGLFAACLGAVFTAALFSTLPATFGFSLFLLPIPALCFDLAYECFRVARCFGILMERASNNGARQSVSDIGSSLLGRTTWITQMKAEIDSTLILGTVMNFPINRPN